MKPDETASEIGVLILAAGASVRMGRPKQLLEWAGEPMVRRMARIGMQVGCGPVWVVAGAHAEEVLTAIEDLPVESFFFPGWAEGMGASLRAGLAAMLQSRLSLEAALVLLVDQPLVDTAYLNQLVMHFRRSGMAITASAYAGTLGPPAIFSKDLFPELLLLEGEKGAKSLLHRHPGACFSVPFPSGAYDLDTPGDWEKRKLL